MIISSRIIKEVEIRYYVTPEVVHSTISEVHLY